MQKFFSSKKQVSDRMVNNKWLTGSNTTGCKKCKSVKAIPLVNFQHFVLGTYQVKYHLCDVTPMIFTLNITKKKTVIYYVKHHKNKASQLKLHLSQVMWNNEKLQEKRKERNCRFYIYEVYKTGKMSSDLYSGKNIQYFPTNYSEEYSVLHYLNKFLQLHKYFVIRHLPYIKYFIGAYLSFHKSFGS